LNDRPVLIITDSLDEGDTLHSALSERGLGSTLCRDPLVALRRVEEGNLELVVCALELPQIDGLELLAKIHYVSPDTPVLLTTRERDLPIDLDAALAGACTILRKPFTVPELMAAVARAMNTRESPHPPDPTVHDSALTSALSGIIRRLRGRRYEEMERVLKEVLRGDMIPFAETWRHLRYEEGLFPPRRSSPVGKLGLESGEGTRSAPQYSRDLAPYLAMGISGASDLARTFLPVLLDHVERESATVDALVAPLGFGASLDLGRRLLLRRFRVTLRGRPDES
jgi:CheY-like chemotaxis protein